jgi:hypothetical protein
LKRAFPAAQCFEPVRNNIDEILPEEAHRIGIKVSNTGRERLAFREMAHFLKFEEIVRVGEDDTQVMRIWGNAGMVAIEGRNGFTRLVLALTSGASETTITNRFLEARRRV